MYREFIFSILTSIAVFLTGCFSGRSHLEEDTNATALREVLKISYPTTQGDQASISDFHGKIVLLHFFSSWCVECAAEAPTLRNLSQAFEGSDFAVVGVAIDDDPYNIQAFVSRFQLPFTVLLDSAGELKRFFSIQDLPVTLFLDRAGTPVRFRDPLNGTETAQLSGSRRWDTAAPVEMIAAMIEAR